MEQHVATAPPVRTWADLAPFVWLPGIAERIASFLPPNEVACNIRLLDKTTAARFRAPEHTTVRLSHPTPHLAFVALWDRPRTLRSLSLHQRRRIVARTAATGVLANLDFAHSISGCTLDGSALEAAAAAGQLGACEWLRARGCPWGNALTSAASAGRLAACNWLLDHGCVWRDMAVFAAARAGHFSLLQWLLERRQAEVRGKDWDRLEWWDVLARVAEGCDLGALRALYGRMRAGGMPDYEASAEGSLAHRHRLAHKEALVEQGQQQQQQPPHEPPQPQQSQEQPGAPPRRGPGQRQDPHHHQQQHPHHGLENEQQQQKGHAPAQARPSRYMTEQQQRLAEPREEDLALFLEAATHSPAPDWAAKIEWLEEVLGGDTHEPRHPSPLPSALVISYACAGAARMCPPEDAPRRLAWLRQRGYEPDLHAVDAAAGAGNIAALEWLLDRGVAVGYSAGDGAAASGHLDALRLLHERGCRLDPLKIYRRAAQEGLLQVLEWAVIALGFVPPQAKGQLMGWAARSGRVDVMAWAAAAAGFGGGPLTEQSFVAAAAAGCEEALEWLAERGCPMGAHGDAYFFAACEGDLATLRCLHRLGCSWGRLEGSALGGVFDRCARADCEPAVLRLCMDLGCPTSPDSYWLLRLHEAAHARRWAKG